VESEKAIDGNAHSIRVQRGIMFSTRQTLKQLHQKRRNGERGAAAVEMALVGLLLITMAVGGGEYGLLMSSKHDLNVATRLAGRIASSPCAGTGIGQSNGIPLQSDSTKVVGSCEKGNTEFDDFYVLRAVESGLGGKMSDVEKIVIYGSPDSDVVSSGRVPSLCLNAIVGVNQVCNIYTKDLKLAGDPSKPLLTNLDQMFTADGALWGERLKDNFGCGSGLPSTPFCPTGVTPAGAPYRIRNISYPTSVGIYVKLKHNFVTGMFREDQTISDWTMFRLEPHPLVNDTLKGCSATDPACQKKYSASLTVEQIAPIPKEDPSLPCVNIRVSISPALSTSESVKLTTYDGTAKAATDYNSYSDTINFGPGETTKTICIPTKNDEIWESVEAFTVKLSDASAGLLDTSGNMVGTTTASATITDDDTKPKLSINNLVLTEGAAAKPFIIGLDKASDVAVTFKYQTVNGTGADGAVAPGDYPPVSSSTGTIPVGSLSFQVPVSALSDADSENDEKFYLAVSDVVGAEEASAPTKGEALIKDQTIKLSINSISIDEGTSSFVTVTLDKESASEVTFKYKAFPGTATPNVDYTQIPQLSGSIPAGSKTFQIPITALLDGELDPNETFTIELSDIVGAATIATIANIKIKEKSRELSIDDISVDEGSTKEFTVSLNEVSDSDVTFKYSTANGSAIAPGDYDSITTTSVTIPAGTKSVTITVKANADSSEDPNETFLVKLTNVTNAIGKKLDGTATINDKSPKISINDISLNEGETKSFTVSLDKASTLPVTFSYSTANGSAVAPGDYDAINSTTYTIPAGSISMTFTVKALTDGTTESDEKFTVKLTNTIGAADGKVIGTATIKDLSPKVNFGNVTINEGGSGNVTATLTAVSSFPVTFKFNTQNGSAVAPDDYTAVTSSSVYTIAAGATSITFPVSALTDLVTEDNETYQVKPISVTGASVGTSGNVTIVDKTAPPIISIGTPAAFNETDGWKSFPLSVDHVSSMDIKVYYTIINGSATSSGGCGGANDFWAASYWEATIPANSLTGGAWFEICDDDIQEGDETFTMTLDNSSRGTISTTKKSAVGKILANDNPAVFVSSPTVTEGQTMTFNVGLTTRATTARTITLVLKPGTATAPDYTTLSKFTVTIPAGTLTVPVTIGTVNDPFVEFTETFTVTGSSPGLTGATGTGTILDNDTVVTVAPTTKATTTIAPTTKPPTTTPPTTKPITTTPPTTKPVITLTPSTVGPTTAPPTTAKPTTVAPTTAKPTTVPVTTAAPTTVKPTTIAGPTTVGTPTTKVTATTVAAPTTVKVTTTLPPVDGNS
jgi:hypothetical protein